MKLISRANFHKTLFWLVVLTVCLSFSVLAQDIPTTETTDTIDTVPAVSSTLSEDATDIAIFTEIELTPEGVTAYDSTGNLWTYDFNADRFRLDERGTRAHQDRREGRDPVTGVEPVENRCTEELRVSHMALDQVFVGYSKYVEEDIVVYDQVVVKGWVKGDIQSISERVLVTATGQVDGDIRAPEIEVKEGGIVLGEQTITDRRAIPVDVITTSFSTAGIWVVFGLTLFLLLVAFLSVTLAPRQLKTMDSCISGYQVRTFFLGLLFVFLLAPITILLIISVIGILVIPLLLLIGLPVALTMGMTACSRTVTKSLPIGGQGREPSYLFYSLTGVLLFMLLWWLVAVLLGANAPVSHGFGIALLVLSIVLTSVPLLTGIGAAVLTRFGFREYVSFRDGRSDEGQHAPAPAPPPMPNRPTSSMPPGRPGDMPAPPSLTGPPRGPLRSNHGEDQ